MAHTALPWNVRDHVTPRGCRYIWIEGGVPIGETRAGRPYKRQILEDEDYDEKADDATLIVTAVNNYAPLIDALRNPSQSVLDCRPAFMSVSDARAMWNTMIDAVLAGK